VFLGEAIDQLGLRLKQDLQNESTSDEGGCKFCIL
jgi:hypothetical protein